ncbi:hypothetical protein [Nocardia huaxiensis]|uniref:YggT family protein n=1 Tax=Nocardia huaxiensis TaxID=2755382 RepID=A0A7D6VGI7_9NOCA|nr:hypothetical protein [Nocardia huaxiensis]QLY29130.1 hypothetical protein H0264_28070 [Nocardia huaxiensis]UFS97377.1 hypothetical protein LPY97_05530 [Nocardia huaxiensis]
MPYLYRTYNEGAAARIIAGVGGLFALIEGVYILLLVFDADQSNRFFTFIKGLAEPLALFFPGLFHTGNGDLDIVLNYGLAAVFWLAVTGFIARLVSRY